MPGNLPHIIGIHVENRVAADFGSVGFNPKSEIIRSGSDPTTIARKAIRHPIRSEIIEHFKIRNPVQLDNFEKN